jgi:hypothetical protein
MGEKSLQCSFIKKCTLLGFFACKVDAAGLRGFPDVFVRTKIGVVLVEMKNPSGKGRLSLHQKALHETLGLLGQHVYLIDSDAAAEQLLDQMKRGVI